MNREYAADPERATTPYGYLLVHFIDDPVGHGERIYCSLSDGDTPLRWTRMNHGEPVLESRLGTTGVRDPYLVRGDGEFYLIATDLRVVGGDDLGWSEWTRVGSRNLVVWRSDDLVEWSEPWLAEVAPPTAGMAWAPEATFDATTGRFQVYWSSHLYSEDDPNHRADSYSRVLVSETEDFREFSEPTIMIDRGHSVIDTTLVRHQGRVYRFSKDDGDLPDSDKVFQEVGSGILTDDFTVVTTRIADDLFDDVEGPLIFRDHESGKWHLWVDQYSLSPQGYIPLVSDDLAAGDWTPLGADEFSLPAGTKHGVVLPLRDGEWDRLAAAYL